MNIQVENDVEKDAPTYIALLLYTVCARLLMFSLIGINMHAFCIAVRCVDVSVVGSRSGCNKTLLIRDYIFLAFTTLDVCFIT